MAKEPSLFALQGGFLLFGSSAESRLDSSLLPSKTGQGLAWEKANSGRQAASFTRTERAKRHCLGHGSGNLECPRGSMVGLRSKSIRVR